jgi:hypothetical protein
MRELKEPWKLTSPANLPLNGVATVEVFSHLFEVFFQVVNKGLLFLAILSGERFPG